MDKPIVINFRSDSEDLLEAYSHQERMACRPFFRFVLGGFVLLWLIGGLIKIVVYGFSIVPFLAVIAGGVLLKQWFLEPSAMRRQLKTGNLMGPDAARDTKLILDEEKFMVAVDNDPERTYEWDSLSKVYEKGDGFLFYFAQGHVHWLPKRAFADPHTLGAFRALLRKKTLLKIN